MRLRTFLFIIVACLFPCLAQGELLVLKDGSTVKGTLVRLENDTLYFKTNFGSAIRVPRDKVLRVEFTDSTIYMTPAVTGAATPAVGTTGEPGTLQIDFDELGLWSKISVHRGRDREGHERTNTIEQLLIIDSEVVFSHRDSITDKVITKGDQLELKNSLEAKPINVKLPHGNYNCLVLIRNVKTGQYGDRFVGDPLEKQIVAENVLVKSGQTTVLRIGAKRGKLGMGKVRLFVLHE